MLQPKIDTDDKRDYRGDYEAYGQPSGRPYIGQIRLPGPDHYREEERYIHRHRHGPDSIVYRLDEIHQPEVRRPDKRAERERAEAQAGPAQVVRPTGSQSSCQLSKPLIAKELPRQEPTQMTMHAIQTNDAHRMPNQIPPMARNADNPNSACGSKKQNAQTASRPEIAVVAPQAARRHCRWPNQSLRRRRYK
jgi:hypothetical protein